MFELPLGCVGVAAGQHLDVMFANVEQEEALIRHQQEAARQCTPAEVLQFQQHMQAVLHEGSFYALPVSVGHDEGAEAASVYEIFQLLSLKPGAKKYMERIVAFAGQDQWQQQVAIARLGRTVVRGGESMRAPSPLQPGLCFDGSIGEVTALSVQTFFEHDFENIYEFQVSNHISCLAETAILDAASAADDGTGDDGEGSYGDRRSECNALSLSPVDMWLALEHCIKLRLSLFTSFFVFSVLLLFLSRLSLLLLFLVSKRILFRSLFLIIILDLFLILFPLPCSSSIAPSPPSALSGKERWRLDDGLLVKDARFLCAKQKQQLGNGSLRAILRPLLKGVSWCCFAKPCRQLSS